ncbi:MAG TPA: hypothetical protein DCL77_19990 [Prolixibacteraceae bacterium]|nr:hypothetical protein [Prolixibacteraceae bacterium]
MLWVFALLLLFSGCNLDDINLDKNLSNESNLNPEMVVPIAKANVTVWDLVQSANKDNEDGITKDSNGLIKIVYQQKNLFQYNGRELIQFPVKENFSTGDKVLGDILPKDIDLPIVLSLNDLAGKMNGAMNGVVLLNGMTLPFPPVSVGGLVADFSLEEITSFKTATLSKGTLVINLENRLKVPISIQGSFFDQFNNREIDGFSFANIAPNETKSLSLDLAGVQLSNQLEFRLISFDTPGSATPININLADYLKIDFNLLDLGISQGNLRISDPLLVEGSAGEFEFTFPEAETKAFSAVLKKGSLTISSTNSSPITGDVDFKLSEIKQNGLPVEAHIPLGGNSTTIDLAGATINFSANPAFPYNRVPYTYSIKVNSTPGYVNYSSTDQINMDVSLNEFEFKSFTGDFGKRSITVDPGNFNMKVDLLDKIEGMFKLANPSLVLTIHNSIGIPASVAIGLRGANKSGQQVILLRNPMAFDLPVPEKIDQGIITGNISYDKQNSNIVEFIALPPTGEIDYAGQIEFNKTNTVTAQNPNFMDTDASLSIDLGLNLPMELQINKLGFKDTTSISGKDFNDVESADLIINALNGIPLDIDLQLLFVDTITGHQFGASKSTKVLSAAKVNAQGEISPVQSSQTFSLDQTEMVNLRKANGLVLSGTVSSPDGGATVAPLYSDSEIKLNVVVKSKVNIKIPTNEK